MDVLNKNGQILLDYRSEYKRHYADSVDEALKNAVYTLYKEGKINERLFRMLLDENLDDLEIYTYLLTQKQFTKTTSELTYEFDVVRQRVNDYLISIGMVDNVSTKNALNSNRIVIIKQYDVPKDILLSFFGLSPTEIVPLMKRKGFMDKFCVLRLNQIFKEIYSELKVPENVDHGYSLVYYNKDIQGFSIDYKYSVNVNYLMDDANMRDVLRKIKELDRTCEKKFQNKLNFAYFSSSKKKTAEAQKEPLKELPKKPIEKVSPEQPKPNPKREDIQSPSKIVPQKPTEPPVKPSEVKESKDTPPVKDVRPEPHEKPKQSPPQDKRPKQNEGDKKEKQKQDEPPKKAQEPPKEKNEEKVTFISVPEIEIDEDDADLL